MRQYEVLEHQLKELDFWAGSRGDPMAAYLVNQACDTDRLPYSIGMELKDGVVDILRCAPSYWISNEIIDVLTPSVVTLPDVPMSNYQPPTDYGYVLGEGPIHSLNVGSDFLRGRGIITGFMWARKELGVDVHLLAHAAGSTFDANAACASVHWAYTHNWDSDWIDFDPRLEGAQTSELAVFLRGFIGSFWAFCAQRISVIHREQLPRSTRRRLEKRWAAIHDPVINIIKLRATESKAASDLESGRDIEWSHRWFVRGHWRNQYYPSTDSRSPLWVSPYIKGPEDKPLKRPGAILFEVAR